MIYVITWIISATKSTAAKQKYGWWPQSEGVLQFLSSHCNAFETWARFYRRSNEKPLTRGGK